MVEEETQQGRFGAIVTSRKDRKTFDVVFEVWTCGYFNSEKAKRRKG